MALAKVNLACGDTFVPGDGWINFDYSSSSPSVRKANLLRRLPLAADSAALVYSSHFLEHIPRSDVSAFLHECRRVLTPGGVLRLVVPDLENLCRAYLAHRERNEHSKAKFVVLELIDQCVRRESGGELGRYYHAVRRPPTEDAAMIDYVRERTGEDLLARSRASLPASGGGGEIPLAKARPASRATLGTCRAHPPAACFPVAECQLGGRGRTASLAVGFRAVALGFGRRRFRGDQAVRAAYQPLCRIPVHAARCRQ